MRVPTMLFRIAIFVATLMASIFITRLYHRTTAGHQPPPPTAPVAQMAGAHEDAKTPAQGPAAFSFKPQLVTLDFSTRKSHTLLVLERASPLPAPEKLWVTTHFFTKDDRSNGWRNACASDAVEVWRAFADGSRTTVTVTAWANNCQEPFDPSATYYAIVDVSTEPDKGTRHLPSSDHDITTLTPVVAERSANVGR